MIFKNELDVRQYLKLRIDDIKDSSQMSHYDMETIKSIIELKVRKTFYDKWMIEKYKYDKLIQLCKDKDCYYVVAFENKLYYYDLKDIDLKDLEKVVMKCPRTTDFENNEMIDKINYVLPNNKKITYDTDN
tara:strand:+ start:553 stop:945 length:393 start_codon:yes stop_codon:yes gene_type:complete